jgi:hypothetical protein
MKELSGTASQLVSAPIEDCFALLVSVDRYPVWHPEVVKEVDIVERDSDGRPTQVRTTLHVAVGPIVRDFHLTMAILATRPSEVTLRRLRNQPTDQEEFEVRWNLAEQGVNTLIGLDVSANLSVPRLIPVGGIGDSMAKGFVVAAAAAVQR